VNALLLRAARLVTCDPALGDGGDPLGVIEGGAVLVRDGHIVALGRDVSADDATVVELPGLVTPGLVEAHTHAVWAGSRGQEYAMRMAGADYEAIGKAGGGIVASMRAVREASLDELAATLRSRLQRMARMGVTTVEVKSGYGLDEASERKQLEAVARAAEQAGLPRVVPTFLGLHALPPEADGDRDGYARRCRGWLDGIAADGLARYVDAYVDRSAFSVAQARPVLERGRELGLGVRLHIGQFADVGGAEMAAALQAASADHLEQLSEEGAAQLAAAGVAAVLLPVASFSLSQAPPPVQRMRDAGLKLVVASDANPGTAPTESLPLAMALAVRYYGLTPAEALLGATRHAAASLGLEAGVLREGAAADIVGWDLLHEDELAQPWGVAKTRGVWRSGRLLA
jgi:imidazolonepropionase